ncbi:hypothetical protein D3C80_1753490 [compost metagenome]
MVGLHQCAQHLGKALGGRLAQDRAQHHLRSIGLTALLHEDAQGIDAHLLLDQQAGSIQADVLGQFRQKLGVGKRHGVNLGEREKELQAVSNRCPPMVPWSAPG